MCVACYRSDNSGKTTTHSKAADIDIKRTETGGSNDNTDVKVSDTYSKRAHTRTGKTEDDDVTYDTVREDPPFPNGRLTNSKRDANVLNFHSADYPFRNVSLPWATRVDNLVSLLTLEEIQLQMARGGHGADVSPAPPIPRLGVGPYSWNTECLRGVVNAGPATSFPQALGLAATFSADVVGRVARATGREVRAKYNNYTRHGLYGDHMGLSCFSPVVNIMRDPRWGRNQETYGEDPYLTSTLATSFVHGLQGNHSRYVLANAGCKHFDVHGGPEDIPQSRFSFNAQVSELDWHQTFLPAFKACVDAGTYSVMCSYNSINGVPACANHKLLTEILRDTWGFTGYVVSDQSALERIVTDHHYVNDYVTAAADAINAGVNIEVSKNNVNGVFMQLVPAMQKDLVQEETIRKRAKPLFHTRMRLGEFDPASMNPYSTLDLSIIQSPAHQALTLEAAMKSFVLLKNKDGFLPIIEKFAVVSVVGPMSNNASIIYGPENKSPTVNVTATVTPLEGLRQLGLTVTHAEGCDDVSCQGYDAQGIKTAVEKADIVLVCLGTGQLQENEGHDRADLELPGQQLQLLQDTVTFSNGAPVVLLLFNACPLNVTWAAQNPSVSAIMECWFPAQSTGTALLHVLTNEGGTSSPAGRLPSTWPLLADQIPNMVNYSMSGRTYRYSNAPALYPFGFGLSYTTFWYSELSLSNQTIRAGQPLQGSVVLRNSGKVTCDEVVQVYIRWNDQSLPAPTLQLAWFDRVTVTGGTSQKIQFTVTRQSMAVWLVQGWTISPGSVTVYVGGQQPGQITSVPSNVLSQDFVITGLQHLDKY
ncbi:hypothetical protein V1264_015821 [Littorina saxatilis]|uniref:Fibronectin type III-like domain-containing protein n=2 Tax=Littorina saxatilis TaxID=31220 RepID=A0AAN9GGF6_9CAEN